MSWQAYVDTSLVGTGHLNKAAIISAAGDSTWASTPDFVVEPEEMAEISKILAEEGNGPAVTKAFQERFKVAGVRYMAYDIQDRHLYGREGRTGVIVVKTKQAILIGYYDEEGVVGNATTTVEALADYLIQQGY
ncbi:profilin [Lasiosphaeria ovina]|uniref:Profilin n=1 Tax=Lasiosphaeria ovina TaxID=92902 RepID=A0AAE0K3P2_9PEZI|nr:profilin [Lasiosphaeria ovina]